MTEKEIVQALRSTDSEVGIAAANMIENLTMENRALRYAARSSKRTEHVPYLRALVAELRKELEWKDMVIALAQKEQAEAEAERDALREKVPQWISVEDRKPEAFAPVIICRNGVPGKHIVEQGHKDVGDWWRVYGTRTKTRHPLDAAAGSAGGRRNVMERLTRPDVDVTEYANKFLNPRLKGKEIDWKRTNDAGIDLLINAITCDEFSKDVFRQMARDLYGRLKAYEDTGLTPEQIKSAFTTDALIKMAAQALETTPERLRELAAADKEGCVVVLPCKRGGKIYAPRKKEIDTYEVLAIAEDEKGVQLLGKCKCSEESWVTDIFNACDFGKSVFLTREEAERAMEGQKND